jgi:uncharacterized protein
MLGTMRNLCCILAFLAMGLTLSGTARAVEVPGLYEAEVPVTGQSAAERVAASRTALEDVLVKVSGNADIAQNPQIEPMLTEAEQWVQRYQYRTIPSSGTAMPSTEAPTQLLWESFDRQTINQHLYDAGIPVWGVNRPATLLWLAIENGGDRYLVGGDNSPDIQAAVNDQAHSRGLPLNVPLLDLQDQGALAVADVWGDFSDMIFKASARYQSDAILVGRVYAVAAGQWQSHWTLYHRGSVTSWESAPGSQDAAIAAGIYGATAEFVKLYALKITPGVGNTVVLSIENINSLADYARVTHYLQSLDPVADAQVEKVEGSNVSFLIKVRGQISGLIQTIALGNTLIAVSPQQPVDNAMVDESSLLDSNEGETSSTPQEYVYRMTP